MRYFIRLAYNGAAYHGWQRQPDAPSVQQTIEEALAVLLRRPVGITGAGRTDAGVNAACMYAHFDAPEGIADEKRFLRSLSMIVPKDIAIYDMLRVVDGAHARFDAISRTYRYYVCHSRSPFTRDFEWFCPRMLDYDAMNRAAALLLDTSDFTSFSKLHTDAKTNICRVTNALWTPLDDFRNSHIPDSRFVFTITADRFLRNMVRAVVGTLVEVGRGKLDLDGFSRVIAARDRCAAAESMPASPLFLQEVVYPSEIFL